MSRILIAAMFVVAGAFAGCKKDDPAAGGGGAAPAAGGGGGSCAAWKTCCDALAAMPNMSAMTASCAAIAQAQAQGATGEATCQTSFSAMKQGVAALPNLPASCK